MEYTENLDSILNKFYDYLYYNDYLNEVEIIEFLLELINELDINEYVKEINFSDYNNYDKNNKKINIKPYIISTNIRKYNKSSNITNYFRIILLILSEVIKYKIINEEDNIDSKILILSEKLKVMSSSGIRYNYNRLYPDNRFVYIESSRVLYNYAYNNKKDLNSANYYIMKALEPVYKRSTLEELYNLITSNKLDIDISLLNEYKRLVYGFKLDIDSELIIDNLFKEKDCNNKLRRLIKVK